MGAGSLQDLSKWWDNLTKRGPCYGYYPNAVKSLLIAKPDKENLARELFKGTNIEITPTGACHLGATAGSEEFRRLCKDESGGNDNGTGEIVKNWRDRTAYCLCCIYSWLETQMDLSIKDIC